MNSRRFYFAGFTASSWAVAAAPSQHILISCSFSSVSCGKVAKESHPRSHPVPFCFLPWWPLGCWWQHPMPFTPHLQPPYPHPSRAPGCKGGTELRSQLRSPTSVTAWGFARTELTWARVLPRARNSQDFCISTSNQRRGRVLLAGGSCWGPLWEYREYTIQVSPSSSIGILVAGLARTWLGWSQTPANPGLAWLQVSTGGSTHPPPHFTPVFHADTSPTECPRLH